MREVRRPGKRQTGDEIDEGAWISGTEMDRRVSEDDPTQTRALLLIWKIFRQNF